jgi:hypothetical protein
MIQLKETLTVGELIARLQKLDPTLPLACWHEDELVGVRSEWEPAMIQQEFKDTDNWNESTDSYEIVKQYFVII